MARGDGRLGHDLLPDVPSPQDACGVFGVFAPGEDVATMAYFGIYALQHRGQESAGIAVSNGRQILVYKDMGLVAQVFDEAALAPLRGGHIAVGHTRYSTTGGSTWDNAQPTLGPAGNGTVALAHNGNLTNTYELRATLPPRSGGGSDTTVITALLAVERGGSLTEAALAVLPRLRGAFSLVFADESTLYAARDPQGVRPLTLGRLDAGWVVASESAALDIVGAQPVREIEPGELVVIDETGVTSHRFAEAKPAGCVFEYVYLARPDTRIAGTQVHAARVEMGRRLAAEHPVEADLVMPVPESGTPAAIGYAAASGIRYGHGLVKNSYVGRTFIQPSQSMRQLGIRLKLNPLREVIDGQRLVVVDDTIVRGNTQQALVKMLRDAGAAEVHVRISSPPVQWPCFYGINFATRDELIASGRGVDQVRAQIGADSLGHLSLAGMIAASGQRADRLCTACFTGVYPIPLAGSAPIPHSVVTPPGRSPQPVVIDVREPVTSGVG